MEFDEEVWGRVKAEALTVAFFPTHDFYEILLRALVLFASAAALDLGTGASFSSSAIFRSDSSKSLASA